MIEIRHLCKSYPNATPIKDLSTVINDGDIIAVIGPSGTGKSTLLRCINMLEKPTSGQIIIDGTDITAPGCKINEVRKHLGMVFQSFNLFPHLTVIENVMQPPVDLLGKSRQEAYDKGMELLHMVGMDGRAMNYPDMLSGGQKQRVAIARTLAMDPEFILFDEPTSALDPTMVGEVQSVIRELARMGKSMMIVTHEMKFAREISNRVFYLDQGGIYEDGSPEQVFDAPHGELTRRFIRHLKVFEAEITSSQHDFLETASQLRQYAFKNLISSRLLYRIEAVFEELCQQILLSRLDDPRISFSVEYDESGCSADLIIRYNGESFDPADTDNMLSLTIVKNNIESMKHSNLDDTPYTNKLDIALKQEL